MDVYPVTYLATRSFNSFSFLLFSLIFLFPQRATGRELRFVHILYRHGDRSPIGSYPKDLHKEDIWTQGFEQLTTSGIKQQYELGQHTRKRYQKLLSASYKRKEIYIVSTDTDRTIMSAQANLAGLFPPTGDQVWNPDIRWQPIPVHPLMGGDDKKSHFPIRDCQRFDNLLKETLGSAPVQDKLKSYMKFVHTIAGHMGYDVKTLLDLNNHKLWNAYDALLCQKIHGYNLPSWADETTMATMKSLLEFGLNAVFGIHKQKEKSQLQGGLLVRDILRKLRHASASSDGQKMTVYSGHDMTIVALQMALGVYNGKLPPYAACMFFELYKEDNGYQYENQAKSKESS